MGKFEKLVTAILLTIEGLGKEQVNSLAGRGRGLRRLNQFILILSKGMVNKSVSQFLRV